MDDTELSGGLDAVIALLKRVLRDVTQALVGENGTRFHLDGRSTLKIQCLPLVSR